MRVAGLALLLALTGCTLASSASTAGPSGPPPPPPPPEASCMGSNLLGWAGRTRLLVGVAAGDAAVAAAPYDIRYQYLAAGVAPGAGPCASCSAFCGSWWGCWQDWARPPGQFVRDFVARNEAAGRIPMLTYYQLLQSMSAPSEGAGEVAAVADPSLLARYLADWRFLLDQVGQRKALLHVEPDFWGYAEHRDADPARIPAAVSAAADPACAGLPDSVAGLGRCMIRMARARAPNARVGLHASAWASGYDCYTSACPGAAAEGARVGAWLRAAGADEGDFLGADMSDRDADWYLLGPAPSPHENRWWDATNRTEPSFTRAFAWTRAMAEAAGRPVIFWQTPVGNSSCQNRTWAGSGGELLGEWRDNRVEYLFAHMGEVAAAHAVGVAYGAGAEGNTTPETDHGVLAAATAAYAASGGAALCP